MHQCPLRARFTRVRAIHESPSFAYSHPSPLPGVSTLIFTDGVRFMSRILIVDDEFYVRSFLRRTLERLGHTVAESKNGREAMRAFADFKPACVILDLFMPEQDGMETIMAIRQRSQDTRIVAISGNFHPMVSVVMKTAGHLGADAVLSKPFSINRLLEAIGSLSQFDQAHGDA